MVSTVAATTSNIATPTAVSQSTASTVKSDYASFLNLLTAQLKNQDPTKPADATQFVAQLAQFSTVEQQVNTNSKLDSLLAAYSANNSSNQGLNTAGTLALLGKTVFAPMSTAQFSGGSVDFSYTSGSDTQANVVQVKDASGAVVRTMNVPLSLAGSNASWNGLTDAGTPAPAGQYTFVLQEYKPNSVTNASKVVLSSQVTGASTDVNGVATLNLVNGDTIKVSDVKRVNETPMLTPNDATLNALAAYAKSLNLPVN